MSEIKLKKAPELEGDLEKLRDEKCIPLARLILADMAELLMPEDANEKVDYNPIVLKTLARTLEADTNISKENTYLFQLILGVFSGLNVTVQSATTLPIDDVRYGAIAKQILKIVSEANVTMGSVTKEDTERDFAPVKEKIDALFLAEKMSLLEVKYVMDNIFTSFSTFTDLFNRNVESSSQKAEAKMFGVESMYDLSMKRLDEVLKMEVK